MVFRTCLAVGAVALCGALTPVSAKPLPAETVSKIVVGSDVSVAYTQYRRGFRRYGYRSRGYYGRRYYRRGYGSGALIGGLAAGALIGGAIASQAQPAPTYAAPAGDATSYCLQRFKSYDPASGTYLGFDGQRHPCP